MFLESILDVFFTKNRQKEGTRTTAWWTCDYQAGELEWIVWKRSLQERELLRDALMAVYREGSHGPKQALEYGWSERFIHYRVQQVMPTGLKADDERLYLLPMFVGPCWGALQEHLHGCWASIMFASSFHNISEAHASFLKIRCRENEDVQNASGECQRAFSWRAAHSCGCYWTIKMGPKPYLTQDGERVHFGCCRGPNAGGRWVDNSNTGCKNIRYASPKR